MELFVIQCTTCQARLKVRDPSLIGMILACPKCHSMVQVVPPTGWKRAAGDATSQAATAGTNATPGAPNAGRPNTGSLSGSSLASSVSSIELSLSAAAGIPPVSPIAPSPASAQQAVPPVTLPPALPSRHCEAAPQIATSAEKVMLTVAATPMARAPLATRFHSLAGWARRDWARVAGAVGAGAIIGTGVWLIVVLFGAPDDGAAEADAPTAVLAKTAAEPRATVEPTPEEVASSQQETPLAKDLDAATTAPSTSDDPNALPAAPVELADVASADEEREIGADLDEASDAMPVATDEVVQPDDALESDSTSVESEVANDDDVAEPATGNRPPRSRRTVAEISAAARRAAEVNPSSGRIASRLAEPLPEIDFQRVPLVDVVQFLVDFSRLSIVIDTESLARAGLKPQTPVTVRLKSATVKDALDKATAPHGLAYLVQEGKLVIVAADAASAR